MVKSETTPGKGPREQLTDKEYFDSLVDQDKIRLAEGTDGKLEIHVFFAMAVSKDGTKTPIYHPLDLNKGTTHGEGFPQEATPEFLSWARDLTGWQKPLKQANAEVNRGNPKL